jgi:hypothetical protein
MHACAAQQVCHQSNNVSRCLCYLLSLNLCRELEDAITWACHLQEELMYLSWPTHLLGMQECR